MINRVFATLRTQFMNEQSPLFICLFSITLILSGCASSDVSRDAAANVDMGVQNAKNLAHGAVNGNLGDTYQNASQTSKGAVLGGTAGAITGAAASGVGVIPGAAAGAILGASYGKYIDSHASLQDQLENRGATMVVLGDQILIILPSSRLFTYMTSTLKQDAYSTLQLTAKYINQYTKMLVKVAAYTNNTEPKEVSLSISQQQATAVSKVLQAYGVDTRVLYAEGYGATHFVEKTDVDWDGNDNYRIEITLEKLPV